MVVSWISDMPWKLDASGAALASRLNNLGLHFGFIIFFDRGIKGRLPSTLSKSTDGVDLVALVAAVVLVSLNLLTEKASKRSKTDVFLAAGVGTTGDAIRLKSLDLSFDCTG